jgi:hypothetical protein
VTQTHPTTTSCPNCQGGSSVPLSDGILLCLDCRHEWNPALTPALRPVPTIPQAGAGDDDTGGSVVHPAGSPVSSADLPAGVEADASVPVSADDGWQVLHDLVGTTVILEGGQKAEIVDFPDDDHVEVLVGIGGANLRTEIVPWDIIERSVDQPAPVADVDDDTARALGLVNLTVAALALQAGLATIEGDGPDAGLTTPPSGWLPADVDSLPMLEQGVAYAVAALILTHGLDRDAVARQADTFLAVVNGNDPTKGGTDDTDSSPDERDDAGVER